MKKYTFNKSAFSLIELSMVILILGILIAGVTKGSALVYKSRVERASSLTVSSPVSRIKDLVAWYETTRDTSFISSEAVEGIKVSKWFDNNPQATIGKDVVQSTEESQPTYIAKCANGLPCLRFIDDGSLLQSEQSLNVTTQELTIFMVTNIRERTGLGSSALVTSGNWLVSTYLGGPYYNINNRSYNRWFGTLLNGYVHLDTFVDEGVADVTFYTNGENSSGGSGAYVLGKTMTTLSIGPTTIVDFCEVIIFSRNLKVRERESVEKYLAKKWGFKLSY